MQMSSTRDGRIVPGQSSGEVIIVAVDASKELNGHALEWPYVHVARPRDHVVLLAIMPEWRKHRKGFWSLAVQCTSRSSSSFRSVEDRADIDCKVKELFLQTMQRIRQKSVELGRQIWFRWEVMAAPSRGATARAAKRLLATWVVIDRHLQREAKLCMEELLCNIVILDRSDARILRLNLKQSVAQGDLHCPSLKSLVTPPQSEVNETPLSSPDLMISPFTTTETGTPLSSSVPYSSSSQSPEFDSYEVSTTNSAAAKQYEVKDGQNILWGLTPDSVQLELSFRDVPHRHWLNNFTEDQFRQSSMCSSSGQQSPSKLQSQETVVGRGADSGEHSRFWKISTNESCRLSRPGSVRSFSISSDETLVTGNCFTSQISEELATTSFHPRHKMLSDFLSSKEVSKEQTRNLQAASIKSGITQPNYKSHPDPILPAIRIPSADCLDLERVSSVRRAVLLSRDRPPGPPPLCSVCQHKSPVFGRPPKRFVFAELEAATDGFSDANFLAEGGFGSVYRGILPGGQPVAVKQHKLASAQGDKEFCSEVEVLSCAQHRNLVMLIGYCIEKCRRLLVYEFVCNGSLDLHLYGMDRPLLEWTARQKIAVGAARGLRYLHEECRVGCIVHRDLRPNNILLTHDFEAMVGDFGLARWQPDGDQGVDTRVIGTFGYLAPEYTQTGQITEKADVYSFGIVLLELISGRKAIDLSRPKGQQCLGEWARPLLEAQVYQKLLDPRLGDNVNFNELSCMVEAAGLCITLDPQLRPKMSQVLHVLDGHSAMASPTSSCSTLSGLEFADATGNRGIIKGMGSFDFDMGLKRNSLHGDLASLVRGGF